MTKPEGHHCLDLGGSHGWKYEIHEVSGGHWINVYVRPSKVGELESDLADRKPVDPDNRGALAEQMQYNDRIDGMESLLLACACAGMDVGSPAFREAIDTALDAIANH